MKSRNSNRPNRLPFWLIALTAILGIGLLIAVYSPEIKSWQISQADKLIALASQAKGQQTISYLEQAIMVNGGDPLATQYLAAYYKNSGDYKKAIQTYQSSDASNNPLYLGRLALRVGDYELALKLLEKANRNEETAETLSGLALSNFAQSKTDTGCEYAEKAKRQNLSSKEVENVIMICQIQKGTSGLEIRKQAYVYAEAGLSKQAIELLEKTPVKSSADWLNLAILYRMLGDEWKTLGAIKSGLAQDPTSPELIKAVISELKRAGDKNELSKYELRLQDLEFKNFQ